MAASKDSVIINPSTGKPHEHWVLSVDFGTSSTIAVASFGGSAGSAAEHEVIEFQGERRMPSMVLVDDDGSLVVGHAAAHLAASRPDRVIRTPKSRLGDQRPVVLGGQAHQPVDLVTAILGHVANQASARMGSAPNELRLTHPVTWNRPLQQRLLEAAAKTGLPGAVLIPEPVAAAMSLGLAAVPAGQSLAIYDLGGGTFDTTVVRSTGSGFEVLGDPVGDPTIGGELFDEMLMNLIGSRLAPEVWEQIQVSEDPSWRQASARMLAESQRVKEALSLHDYAEAVIAHPGGVTTERVTRGQFEELIEPYIAESIRLTNWSLIEAGVQDSLAAIRLVGGASRMPIVARMFAETLPGVVVQTDHDPRTAAALGASMAVLTTAEIAEAVKPERSTLEEEYPPPFIDSRRPHHPAPATVAAPPTAPPMGAAPSSLLAKVASQSPAVLALAGVFALFLFVGAVWALWPPGDEVAADEIKPVVNSTIDTGGGLSSTVPTPEVSVPPVTEQVPTVSTTPTTVAPILAEGAIGPEKLQSVLFTDVDMGSSWTSRTYTVADNGDLFCEMEPAAIPIQEEGRTWDSGLLSFSHILYEFGTEQEAIDLVAQDRTVGVVCTDTTQVIYGLEFTLAVVQDESFTLPDNLTFGDETAAAGFVLLSADAETAIHAIMVEQRWGRTIAQTIVVSTEILSEDQIQEFVTRTLTALQRHVELDRL